MARKLQEINAGSMADIAFLLLIFFLVTTTMDTDTGLPRKLPPLEEEQTDSPPIKERNVFIVLLNSSDQLMVEGEPLELNQLREKAKEFIANPENKSDLPEKTTKFIEGLGREMQVCSKAVISLQNDNGTTYEAYMYVQNELVAAYNDLRNEFAKREWGKAFEELNEEQQDAVKKVYKQAISNAEPKNVGK